MRIGVVVTALSVAVGIALADPAAAAIKTRTNIAAQGLGSALREFAADRHLQILYTTETVANQQTPGAVGELTIDETLTRLLGGTGLVYRYVDENTITIMSLDDVGASSPRNASESEADAQQSAKDQPADMLEMVIVTGLRNSLQQAQAIKMNSDSILDSIVAEDIGKLPDNTAAESAARLPGVQVVRYNDEVSGVLIRGLPDVATSYNGREIFTAELRRVELQDFPSQAIAQMDVYKSGAADSIEPGLAGLVNVRTRRPFDFKESMIAGGTRGTYNDQSGKFDPTGNLLFSDRWRSGIGDLGLLVNVTYAQAQYYNGVRYNNGWIRQSDLTNVTTPNVGVFRMPNSVGLYNESGKRFRPSGNFSAQWAPNDQFELYFDGLYQGYRGHGTTDSFEAPLIDWDTNDNRPTLSNVDLIDGTDQAASLTHSGGLAPQGWRRVTRDGRNTYQLATGAKWHNDRFVLSTDVAYTWSEYFRDAWSVDFAARNVGNIDVAFNQDGGAVFSLPGWDASKADNYSFRGYWNETYHMKGYGWQWRTDASYDTGLGFLRNIEAGVRLTDRTAEEIKYGTRYGWVLPLGISESALPVGALQMTRDPFRGSAQGLTSYLSIAPGALYDNRGAIRQFTYNALQQMVAMNPGDQGALNALDDFSTSGVQPDPTRHWKSLEPTYAGYVQGKYGFSLGSIDVDGVVGVRVVRTESSGSGVSSVCLLNATTPDPNDCTSTYTPRTDRQNYTDVLPNISMRVKFIPQLQLRLGFTETRTKPEFRSLNPALFINPVNYGTTGPTTPGSPIYSGSSGNPDLKPFTSKNYDASLEYYFSNTGSASAAIFRRDLDGFLTNVTVLKNDPAYGVLQLSQPINAGDGKIDGFELNAQSFLNFLPSPWDGLGVSGNVTYLDGKTRYPNGYDPNTNTFTGPGQYQRIPGLSEWTYNAAAFFEKNGITARLSYWRRSEWVNWYSSDQNGEYAGNSTRALERLDGSISYDVNKQFTVTADVANILAQPYRNFTQYTPGSYFPNDVRDEGRYYGLSMRFRFGD